MRPSSTELSDEQLLELIRKSKTNERGFGLLMGQYQERLYFHIRKLVIDHEDANDVLQNCFIKVYKNIHNFEGKSKLYTWMYRIATNEAITFLNKKKRKATTSIDEGENHLINVLEADSYFEGDRVTILLQAALKTLPEKQRLVFNMRYFDEMRYRDMSEILETSIGALKASYHHAVKKIEKYLKELST